MYETTGSGHAPFRSTAPISAFPAVFVTNHLHRIVGWNRGAEEVLGKSAGAVMGRCCHETVRSTDVFGNRFCYRNCPVTSMARLGETPRSFEIFVPRDGEEPLELSVTVRVVPGETAGAFSLHHFVSRPGDDAAAPLEGAFDLSRGLDSPLTPREKEILKCAATGSQNKEIARTLAISRATVRNHIRNILGKLDVHSKLEAVSLAFRRCWIAAPKHVDAPARRVTEEVSPCGAPPC